MASPWKTIEVPTSENLDVIMSKQLSQQVQSKGDKELAEKLSKELNIKTPPDFCEEPGPSCSSNTAYDEIPEDVLKALQEDDDANNDELIAKLLQAQFDLEHDAELRKVERHKNKDSKVKISYKNYRLIPDDWLVKEDELDSMQMEAEQKPSKDWDRFETVEKEFNQMPKCGYKLDEDGEMVTKHDERMNGVRNACRVMSFPPDFPTGDGAGFDMKLSNKVFNQLKSYSRKSKKTKMHDRKENVATAEMGIDEPTRLLLYKLINNQVLEQVNGIISTGKEAIILHADCDENYSGELILPKECAIKIFKTTLNEFKQRDRYIKDDYRFKDRFSKQNNRTVISMWAEKEMHNLMRMRKAGINCPDVVMLKKHVLVMSFIGENNRASPKLKDAILSDADLFVAYEEILEMMTRLYQVANLVHADLSEYNILYHDEKCYFIDVAQSIEPSHPSAFEYLLRDCGNIVSFFEKKGVSKVNTKEELFTDITGLDPNVHHTTMLERLHNKGVPEHVATATDIDELPDEFKPVPYPFDYAWEKTANKKEKQDQEVDPVPVQALREISIAEN